MSFQKVENIYRIIHFYLNFFYVNAINGILQVLYCRIYMFVVNFFDYS